MTSYEKERSVLNSYINLEINITKSKIEKERYSGVDVKFISAGTWCAMEAKVRDKHSRWPDYYIEKTKVDSLFKYFSSGVTTLYLNYFTEDEVCLIWDLQSYFSGIKKFIWKWKLLPEKTSTVEFPEGTEVMVWKEVANLPTKSATYVYQFQI